MTKLDALELILKKVPVHNEAGQRVMNFVNKRSDAQDFMSVSKRDLFELMSRAYDAGKASK